jgi:hypothetical protein
MISSRLGLDWSAEPTTLSVKWGDSLELLWKILAVAEVRSGVQDILGLRVLQQDAQTVILGELEHVVEFLEASEAIMERARWGGEQ